MQKRLLIVEGEEDKEFFTDVLAVLKINTKVTASTDNVVIESKGSKDNALKIFEASLARLSDSVNIQIGLVVDADDPNFNSGGGFLGTQSKINIALQKHKFNELTVIPNSSGFMSQKIGFQAKVGVWIMPNNQDNGYLEHFSTEVISESEKARFEFAHTQTKKIIDGEHQGPEFSFKKHHFQKAALGAWLAWSDPPGMGPGFALRQNRLDTHHVEFNKLKTWLHWLYGSDTV